VALRKLERHALEPAQKQRAGVEGLKLSTPTLVQERRSQSRINPTKTAPSAFSTDTEKGLMYLNK
jgi:hypothetical protein